MPTEQDLRMALEKALSEKSTQPKREDTVFIQILVSPNYVNQNQFNFIVEPLARWVTEVVIQNPEIREFPKYSFPWLKKITVCSEEQKKSIQASLSKKIEWTIVPCTIYIPNLPCQPSHEDLTEWNIKHQEWLKQQELINHANLEIAWDELRTVVDLMTQSIEHCNITNYEKSNARSVLKKILSASKDMWHGDLVEKNVIKSLDLLEPPICKPVRKIIKMDNSAY